MSQQDHKISSMVSLISSLAEESQQNNNTHGGFIPSLPPVVASASASSSASSSSSSNKFISNHLIHVSDDEEEEDSESESESESESSDSESETDASSDSDDEKSVNDDVKTITILSEDLAKEDTTSIIFEVGDVDDAGDIDDADEEDDNSLFEMDDLQFEVPDVNVEEKGEEINVEEINVEEINVEEINVDEHADEDIKSIYLEQPSVNEITDFSIFKTINISSLDESVNNLDNTNSANSKIFETSDYKKMSITKLREIVSKQGVPDASKLKKSDIFKMLGVE
jgi:hypothetical protein